jgi:ABC-2 type transport system permease protein
MTVLASSSFAPAPSLARLVAIELRKTVDTRAGFWLFAASALLAIVVVGLTLAFGHATDLMFGVFFARTVGTVGVLLPVVGILAITSEWSQRTAVTTFALVPRRERVIAAKLLAGLVVALASVAVCLAISLAATALVPVIGHADGRFDVAASALGSAVLFMAM